MKISGNSFWMLFMFITLLSWVHEQQNLKVISEKPHLWKRKVCQTDVKCTQLKARKTLTTEKLTENFEWFWTNLIFHWNFFNFSIVWCLFSLFPQGLGKQQHNSITKPIVFYALHIRRIVSFNRNLQRPQISWIKYRHLIIRLRILSDNKLQTIEKEAFSGLRSLKRLVLQNCGLKNIPFEALESVETLTSLWVFGVASLLWTFFVLYEKHFVEWIVKALQLTQRYPLIQQHLTRAFTCTLITLT